MWGRNRKETNGDTVMVDEEFPMDVVVLKVEKKYKNLCDYADFEIKRKVFLFTEGTSKRVQEGRILRYSPSGEFVCLLGSGLAGTHVEIVTGKLSGTGDWINTADIHILEILGDIE